MKPASLRQKLEESLEAVRKVTSWAPEVAVILGTGLGNLARRIKTEAEVNYSAIPHFPRVTVESHAGKLVFGTLSGKKVAALEGRFHAYEGYSMEEVVGCRGAFGSYVPPKFGRRKFGPAGQKPGAHGRLNSKLPGHGLRKSVDLCIFCQKLHQKEKIGRAAP